MHGAENILRTQTDPPFALTIALSTIGERARTAHLPPPTEGVEVLVLVQQAPEDLSFEGRADVRVVPVLQKGIVASRNAALTHARSEFLLFADDDIELNMTTIRALQHHLEEHPDRDIVTCRRSNRQQNRREGPLSLTNIARTATPEIMVRLAAIRETGVTFDPDFGIGARYPLGDEFVFLADLLKAGKRGDFLPLDIGHHPAEGTGTDWSDPKLLNARGATLRRVFGRFAPLVALGFVIRHWARLPGLKAKSRILFPRLEPSKD